MGGRGARQTIHALAILCITVSSVAAQSTREEWIALREHKQARQALAAAATVTGPLTIVSLRFYSDATGRLVGVGEARNNSTYRLSYARLEFAFYDDRGGLVGAELTYVHGGFNERILDHQLYENVLFPGGTGFFKVWSSIPAAALATYTVASAGEDLPFASPLTQVFASNGPASLSGLRYSGQVRNWWTQDTFDPRDTPPPVIAYPVRVFVAAYQDGTIAGVQSTLVNGSSFEDPCGGVTPAAIAGGEYASYSGDLDRPANSIGRMAIEWDEFGVSTDRITLADGSDRPISFSVVRQCGWTAAADVPWIRITAGARSDRSAGTITFEVRPNLTGATRTGRINVSGLIVTVVQRACDYAVSPQTLFVGSSGADLTRALQVTATCSWTAALSATWLTVTPSTNTVPPENLTVRVQPNLTGATRRAVVSFGRASATIVQSAGGRNADFNRDGQLDLLWHHQTDGRISTWLMRGAQVLDGRLLNPAEVADTNWKLVGTADLNRDGWPDLVWQHATDGRVSWWRMNATTRTDGRLISQGEVADTNWKIRAVADFDGNGIADLVWQHESTGQIAVWFMQADLFGTTVIRLRGDPLGPGQVPDVNWKIVGTGDFNLDGSPDLVWQHQGDGRIAVWTMRGTTLVDGGLISPGQIADLDWKIRGVGDINGDDMPDLIWQHRISGDVSTWLMNGTTMMSGISIRQVPDTEWQIVAPR